MWMVRAGRDAFLIDDFEKNSVVAIGWDELGDISSYNDPEKLKMFIKETYPEFNAGQLGMAASQVNKFKFDFNKGDFAVSYNPEERVYFLGEILSNYIYQENKEYYNHVRKVKWLGKVNRDDLKTSTRNTLGAISTIFNINAEAAEDILNSLKGKKPLEEEEQEEELEIIKEDVISNSSEFIKDKVIALNWEEMQELVAGVLRAMGYKTMVSPKGADRGKDIMASPDGLGLEEPRIVVEVKHRKGRMGAPEIRSFTGGLRRGSKGLYVSTGGFSHEAKYEAERSEIPVTLIDSDILVQLIIQYYDQFDNDSRSLIPLTKIYWPT
jgi:restriction system protein